MRNTEKETNSGNEELQLKISTVITKIQEHTSNKNDIIDDIKIVSAKVLNKSHQDLKVEVVQQNLEKLEGLKAKLESLKLLVDEDISSYNIIGEEINQHQQSLRTRNLASI